MQPPDDDIDIRDARVVYETVTGEIVSDEIDAHVVEAEIAVREGDDIEILDDGDDIEVAEDPQIARPPRVDPRIRARRIAVAREQGRRRLRVVLVLLSVFVAVGFAWLIVQSPFFDVDHIVVTGVPPARVAAVVAATGVHRHDALLMVSAAKVKRRVEAVPGVGTVKVSRDFPGTLRISVSELGIALWARVPAGGVALVGHDGRVVRYAPTNPPGIVELRGQKLVPAPGGRLIGRNVVGVLAQLPTALLERVGAISAITPSDVRLYLIVGGEVRLGDLSSAHDKGVVAEAVIERMACQLVYVDVRSVSNPVALPAPGAVCH